MQHNMTGTHTFYEIDNYISDRVIEQLVPSEQIVYGGVAVLVALLVGLALGRAI